MAKKESAPSKPPNEGPDKAQNPATLSSDAATRPLALPSGAFGLLQSDANPGWLMTRRQSLTGSLEPEKLKLIVEQALLLFEKFYVNRPLKESLHAVRPVRRLQLLASRLETAIAEEAKTIEGLDIHVELTRIFNSVRDRHMRYQYLPSPKRIPRAFLGILIEAFFEGTTRKYVISHVAEHNPQQPPDFLRREVEAWNGIPIQRAIELNAARLAGSNPAAQHAYGLSLLTLRPLDTSPPPDEDWVIITYLKSCGERAHVKLDWQVIHVEPNLQVADTEGTDAAQATALDAEGDALRQLKQTLFAGDDHGSVSPSVVDALRKCSDAEADWVSKVDEKHPHLGEEIELLPEYLRKYHLRAWRLPQEDGVDIGYIRIYSFDLEYADSHCFLRIFERLLRKELPKNGLILDIRDNPGGSIRLAEHLLQYLCPERIEPMQFQFLSSNETLQCSRREPDSVRPDWSRWKHSLKQAADSGATYSEGFTISDTRECNAIGQIYYGPVVLLTSALSYSSSDILAAGFQDHGIGPILGTDKTTGAGGANVVKHSELLAWAGDSSPLEELPPGAEMRVALRRAIRGRSSGGRLLEDYGVASDLEYQMKKCDLTEKNKGLIGHARRILATMPRRSLKVKHHDLGPRRRSYLKLKLTITVMSCSECLSRVDITRNGRTLKSDDVEYHKVPLHPSTEDPAYCQCEGATIEPIVRIVKTPRRGILKIKVFAWRNPEPFGGTWKLRGTKDCGKGPTQEILVASRLINLANLPQPRKAAQSAPLSSALGESQSKTESPPAAHRRRSLPAARAPAR